MKKLALALVCLIGVAFLSSCDPKNVVENPQPSIVFMTGETFVEDGDVLDYYGTYDFGVKAASNPETLEELARLVITFKSGDESEVLLDSVISGKEFTFQDVISFTEDEKTIIGSFEITAEVTDAAGEKKAVTLKCDVDLEDDLSPMDFTWHRHGGDDGTGLAEFGLSWTANGKEDFAIITPVEGALLYEFDDPSVWESTTTETELAALFSEQPTIEKFNKVSAWSSQKYNLVIGTTYEGYNYLIHITSGTVTKFKGTDIVIEGQFK